MSTQAAAVEPRVTIIVTSRERFGIAEDSLASIFEHADVPFSLVYVTCGVPPRIRDWVAAEARRRRFRHVDEPGLLTPNESRNLGLAHATTPYVVFVENDVICAPGWLRPLLDCADETKADVVTPLTCQGAPLHTVIHQAGGDFAKDPATFFASPAGGREINEVMYHQGAKIDATPVVRRKTQCCEFHCVLVRRQALVEMGGLDPQMVATKEHLDFCMSIMQRGGRIFLEPRSIVTYLYPSSRHPLAPEDWRFFLFRWSRTLQKRSLARLRAKWGIASQEYFDWRDSLYDWRHVEAVVKPVTRKLPVIGRVPILERIAAKFLSLLTALYSAYLVSRYDRTRRRALPKASGASLAADPT